MRKLLLFMLAAFAFAACEQAPIEELSVVRADAPETLTVSLEGDDTRIQLNKAQKTVWTKGDQVSVFYRSNANQLWKYTGATGSRTANLKRVDAGSATRSMDRVVVVYPYNEDYYINPSTFNVQASLPAVQHYLKDSYGLDGNIMISSAEYNDVTLKNVCGWLKLQLTGNGEVVKSIKFRGNNGEQVAGELYINSADATAILASDMGNIAEDDGENATGGAGANLSFDDVVLKEVTLDCGEGVELGAEATTFYIALPPQTFERGFTVDVECEGYKPMVISTENALTIERNFIQPMASKEHNAAIFVPYNQIWYTSSDGKVVTPHKTNDFGATIVSNTYNRGKGIITFDGDVTTIGSYAFYDCDSLTSVTIPNSVTTIGSGAFYDCANLTSVNIGDSVTTIGYEAFASCDSLTSITIPDSVTTIREAAFAYCYSLTSVTIPDSVTTIGERAFVGCNGLAEFKGKFAEDNGRILVVDGVLTAFAPAGITEYTIPDGVTTIGNYAFAGCHSLKSVTIPDSVTTIGERAFYDCDSLTSVTIPNSVTTIKNYAFYDCYSLTSVTIPNSVTTIEHSAFSSCSSLTSVIIPDSVTTIEEGTFYSCNNLTSVTIPNSVTTIGKSAFYHCYSLTSVTIPNSVTTIGEKAFFSCSSLTSVIIPDSVTTIGDGAFSTCDNIAEFKGKFAEDNGRILVVDGVLKAFAPTGISEYTIPDSVTEIGGYAFFSCDSLTSVTIPDSVTTIGVDAFGWCRSLTGITIPDSVTTIGERAFRDCGSLTSVTIPDSVTTIGSSAFDGCRSLKSVTIPDSVTTIGERAFYECETLKNVYCKATTPPALGSYVFHENNSHRKIYVPTESVDAYKSAWSEYSSDIVGYNF